MQFFRGQTGAYFLINGLAALSFSFILPIMSLFLVDGLGAKPGLIGVYTTLTAMATIVISQMLGGLTDRGASAKRLLLIALGALCLAATGFSLANQFWHALLVGVCLMSLGSSSIPIILGMIRRYAESTGKNSTRLNSQMRSSVSLLWILGPPIAFFAIDRFGFQGTFYLSAAVAAVVFSITIYAIHEPKPVISQHVARKGLNLKDVPASVWLLGVMTFCANMANSAYINAMPLYLTQQLAWPKAFPGILLGMTAAVEIPVMLLAARWSESFGKEKVVMAGFGLALCFYIGLQVVDSQLGLFLLQILNGTFFGIFVGLGISLMQDNAPNIVGKVSAFYTNSMLVGTMAGTSMMGIVSQYFGYKAALMACLIPMVAAIGLLILFMRSQHSRESMANKVHSQ
ncbi:sugar efflux transporter [Vibrio olivae]|uniref:Sugar efflux transporter n=1 Tax=Vibrio olivae TaxID=1243002 RepID=A0ABV5HU02_9VIBR